MYLGEKPKDGLKKCDKTRKREIKRPHKCTILVRPLFNGARYVQDKVREGETGNPSRSQPGLPGTGREGALGYERYAAGAGSARAACVNFAQRRFTCLVAKVL